MKNNNYKIIKKIPFDITKAERIPAKEFGGTLPKIVFMALCRGSTPSNNHTVKHSQQRLAESTGLCLRSIKKQLKTLASNHWINITARYRKSTQTSNQYRLNTERLDHLYGEAVKKNNSAPRAPLNDTNSAQGAPLNDLYGARGAYNGMGHEVPTVSYKTYTGPSHEKTSNGPGINKTDQKNPTPEQVQMASIMSMLNKSKH